MATREVDNAMRMDRPAKIAVRRLWMACLKEREAGWDESIPLYLTLPGADGRDLLMACDEGIIRLTETGSLHPDDVNKVVAVESSSEATATLLGVIPGLRILDQPIQSLVRGVGMTTWPDHEHRRFCRAVVVNLDLNRPFSGSSDGGVLQYPIATWIRKLAFLHGELPPVPWSLLLTLHAEASFDADARRDIHGTLVGNAARIHAFREGLSRLIGVAVEALDPSHATFNLDRESMHRLLLAIVPKHLARELLPGWTMDVKWCLSYGGQGSEAPMVAFRIDFAPADQPNMIPPSAYESVVSGILKKVWHVAQDGHIQE